MDAAVRQLVRHRAAERCEYCRLPQLAASVVAFHVEHIIPKQHGGDDDPSNLALACPHCNRYKGPNLTAIDPDTNQIVQLFNPRTQLWDKHFALDGVRVVGVTSEGRATAHLFRMNAEERVKVREELQARCEF